MRFEDIEPEIPPCGRCDRPGRFYFADFSQGPDYVVWPLAVLCWEHAQEFRDLHPWSRIRIRPLFDTAA